MNEIIPVTNDLRQTFTITLGGRQLRFTIYWNPTDGYWYIDLTQQDGTPLLYGRRIVTGGFDLLANSGLYLDGVLTVQGSAEPLGTSSWGVTHYMVWSV